MSSVDHTSGVMEFRTALCNKIALVLTGVALYNRPRARSKKGKH